VRQCGQGGCSWRGLDWHGLLLLGRTLNLKAL
jgi:hypothetical protein